MDPDVALRELRDLAAAVLDVAPPGRDQADELAERFSALDEWIMSGGHLPAAWHLAQVEARTEEQICQEGY